MITENIELNEKQFRELLIMVNIGHWITTGYRDEDDLFDDTQQYLSSFHWDFKITDIVEYIGGLKSYFPTPEMKKKTDKFLEKYDEYTLWVELAWKLADRDFKRKFSKKEIKKMSKEEIFEAKRRINLPYFKEFSLNGIQNFTIKGERGNRSAV